MFCFIQRWRIDRALDEGAGLNSRTRRHVAECDGCRSHRTAQEKLVALLNQPQPAPDAPPFLRANVMNAIRVEETGPVGNRWLLPVWVPIAACALLAFFLIPENTPPTPAPKLQPVAQVPDQLPVQLPSVELPAVNMAKTLEQVQDTLAAPYAKELESLQNDLKAAGGYMGELFNFKIASLE
jgi:hypothetical protein